MIVLYDKDSTSFNSLGIGVLTDFRDTPTITEVLKGEYILEFDYLKNGKYSEFLDERNLIKALGQVFRIENIQPSNDGYRILARHIVFDLKDNYLVNVAPTNKTAQEALEWVLERACFKTNFNVSGDCTKITSAKYIRMNLDEALFSADNSILSRFGGEPEYDNYHIILHNRRGKDTGIEIRERKNLTGFEMNKDLSTVKTRIMPVGPDGLLLPEVFIDSPLINNYQTPKIGKLEISNSSDEEVNNEDLFQMMRDAVFQEFENGIDKPTISIKVDFIELSKTEEYKKYQNLETVSLGDTLKFIVPSLNQHFLIRVIKTVRNANNGTIISLELGNEVPNFITSQKQNIQMIKEKIVISTLEQAKMNATNLLKHPFNGHWFFDETVGCAYICDTKELSSAKNVWQIGLGGIGVSNNGIDGPFRSAWTLDGGFVADFITTGNINTNLIEGYEQLVQKVSKTEESVENIITTTQTSTGNNHLCIDESLEANALEYIIYGKSKQESIPSITNPSEIKTISSIRNLLETDLLKFASKGIDLEFERSTVKIDGTSTNQGTQTIKTKTNLKKGIYTISFWKLGGTLERTDSNDCQLFVQTSDGTTERLTNITGSRLENNENAKTTINLEEDKEIFLYFYYKGDLVFNNYEIGVQIEEGSIMHDYRPSGAYTKVKITGNNQFNLKAASRMSYSYGLPNKQTSAIEIENYDSNNLSFSMLSNNYGYILSNTHYLKPNTDYLLSYNRKNTNYPGSSNTRYYIYTIDENGDYVDNQHSSDTDGDKQYLFTTNETGMVAFAWGADNKSFGASSVISNIMIVEKVEETEGIEFEPSKENEVLIDLNKYDFDKNIIGYYELCTDDVLKVEGDNVEIEKKHDKYILSGEEKIRLISTDIAEHPYYQITLNDIGITNSMATTKLISNKFLGNEISNTNANIGISFTTSYMRIRFDKDYNSEEIKNILQGTVLYYPLKESQNILIQKAEIPLFDGINHIQFMDDIETTTSIKLLRKTPLSNDYVVQPQLKETNDNLANTTDKTNQNASDINAVNTNLNNNFYNKNQINEMQTTTNQNIVQVRNTVETLTTSTEYKINTINETITNGVPLVKTTSTAFGEDGWSMEKSGQEMSSKWDWQGFEVTKDKGKSTEEKTLVANSNGVTMNNSETKNRSIQRPIMHEKGTSISDGKSVGLCHYYIGE